MIRRPPRSTRTDTLFPYTTLFRSSTATIFDLPIRGVNVQADHGLVVESAERRSGYGDEPGAIQRPPHEPRKVQAARNPKGQARRQFEQTASKAVRLTVQPMVPIILSERIQCGRCIWGATAAVIGQCAAHRRVRLAPAPP